MNKRQITYILCLTAAAILILALTVGSTIKSVNLKVRQYCFDELANTALHLADDLEETDDMDSTILGAMAALIANEENPGNEKLGEIMRAYNTSSSYVSYVELLKPDNTMLDSDGTIRDVSETFFFPREAQLGKYVSDISQSTLEPSERVIRNAVPVVKNGETIYMLYGVVRLSDFEEKYITNIYDGHAFVYLVDGDTGEFLLDTWHKTNGNVNDFNKRTMLPGYSFDEAKNDMQYGRGGDLGFVSKTTGNILYMHYEPVGVNNWNVLVSVEEKYALSESSSVSTSLYTMTVITAAVMLLYMACIAFSLIRAYRSAQNMATHDQNTGLKNRTAYEKYISDSRKKMFSSIVCVYVDANGLHEINNRFGHSVGDQMLCNIADALVAGFGGRDVYRIGGDEFVVFCEGRGLDECSETMKGVAERVASHGYSISQGTVCRENEMGVDRITQEADELMLENKKKYYQENGMDRRR